MEKAEILIGSDPKQYIVGALLANIRDIKDKFNKQFNNLEYFPKLNKINDLLSIYDSY